MFFGVPTLYAVMLADPACTPENGSARLRMCVSAGEGAARAHRHSNGRSASASTSLDGVGSTEMLHIFLAN